MKKKDSYSSCRRFQFSTAPRRLPNCILPVGRIPDNTLLVDIFLYTPWTNQPSVRRDHQKQRDEPGNDCIKQPLRKRQQEDKADHYEYAERLYPAVSVSALRRKEPDQDAAPVE